MSMFDTLYINLNKLPITDDERKLMGDKNYNIDKIKLPITNENKMFDEFGYYDFQTRDLGCNLDFIYINENNSINAFKYEWKDQSFSKRDDDYFIDAYFNDELYFYCGDDFEFKAIVKDNFIISIKRINIEDEI